MADTKYIDYLTKDGDRWDTIAWSQYADLEKINLLIEANPLIPIYPVLPGGLRILIPIMHMGDIVQNTQFLPPWKQPVNDNS